jgi:CBS-domain-containing membrane protein
MSNQPTHSVVLEHVRVRDCMHPGTLTCGAEDSLRDVAATMASQRVHVVVIRAANGEHPVGVVSDLDLVATASVFADC